MEQTIYLAGGCFWGVEKVFEQFAGLKTEVGYANSMVPEPSYEYVCTGRSHAAEAVKIDYDPGKISLAQILYLYFCIIDPTSRNRQGNDVGTQYRTGIYWTDPKQEAIVRIMLSWLDQKLDIQHVIETGEILNFWPAETYHQKYLDKNPGGYCHIPSRFWHVQLPSVSQLEAEIPGLKQAEEQQAS